MFNKNKYKYRYEVHLHTCECSACGVSSAREMVLAAYHAGYSGVVFTNHFYRGNTCVDRGLDWKDFVKAYEDDYLDAKEFGRGFDIDVLFGIEENYFESHEALIYGLSPAQVAAEPRIGSFGLPELSEYVRSCGGVIICAHPYRDRGYIPDPDIDPDMRYFDAIEVYNQFNRPVRNAKAAEFAAEHGTAVISGGDVHNAVNFGCSGLAFPQRVRDNETLVRMLKEQRYELLIEKKNYTQQQAIELTMEMR